MYIFSSVLHRAASPEVHVNGSQKKKTLASTSSVNAAPFPLGGGGQSLGPFVTYE